MFNADLLNYKASHSGNWNTVLDFFDLEQPPDVPESPPPTIHRQLVKCLPLRPSLGDWECS